MSDSIIWAIIILGISLLLISLFRDIKKHTHESRSVWRWFGLTVAAIIAAPIVVFAAFILLLWLIEQMVGTLNFGPIVKKGILGAGMGGVLASMFGAWEQCKKWMARPNGPRNGGGKMSDLLRAAIIVAIAIVLAAGLLIYFSPYQSCVRAEEKRKQDQPEIVCAAYLGGRR